MGSEHAGGAPATAGRDPLGGDGGGSLVIAGVEECLGRVLAQSDFGMVIDSIPSAAEVDQGNQGSGGVNLEGAVADQPHLGVEALQATVR